MTQNKKERKLTKSEKPLNKINTVIQQIHREKILTKNNLN